MNQAYLSILLSLLLLPLTGCNSKPAPDADKAAAEAQLREAEEAVKAASPEAKRRRALEAADDTFRDHRTTLIKALAQAHAASTDDERKPHLTHARQTLTHMLSLPPQLRFHYADTLRNAAAVIDVLTTKAPIHDAVWSRWQAHVATSVDPLPPSLFEETNEPVAMSHEELDTELRVLVEALVKSHLEHLIQPFEVSLQQVAAGHQPLTLSMQVEQDLARTAERILLPPLKLFRPLDDLPQRTPTWARKLDAVARLSAAMRKELAVLQSTFATLQAATAPAQQDALRDIEARTRNGLQALLVP